MKRIKGFVVGQDNGGWKVRVKQEGSKYDGSKLTVASISENITLASGLNVDFLIGSRRDRNVAIDVRIFSEDNETESKEIKMKSFDSLVFNFFASLLENETDVFITPLNSKEEVEQEIESAGGDEECIAFKSFDIEEECKRAGKNEDIDEIIFSFGIIQAVANTDTGRIALELLLTAAFNLGNNYQRRQK